MVKDFSLCVIQVSESRGHKDTIQEAAADAIFSRLRSEVERAYTPSLISLSCRDAVSPDA